MSTIADAIMDAAERRIRIAGYCGFSFREVAVDVGIKSASVHYHFPTKESLGAAVARRYTERFLATVDADVLAGTGVVEAWCHAFRSALSGDGMMCLCGVLGATTGGIPLETMAESKRFFQLALERLRGYGLARERAAHVLATLEGAMLLANSLGDPSVFDEATRSL